MPSNKARLKPVKMRPVKAWAIVDKQSGDMAWWPYDCIEDARTDRVRGRLTKTHRIVPVLITEIVPKKK